MASAKTAIIERLFDAWFDAETGRLSRTLVTFADIQAAIRDSGVDLSDANPANFWKDLIRNPRANENWPASVLRRGYTGADAIGQGPRASFSFVPLPAGQESPFVAPPTPTEGQRAAAHPVQSLSLPLAAKALGRRDENWLAQVAQRLSLVETHFAIASNRRVLEVDFLQTGIKLRRGEVDGAYRITEAVGIDQQHFLVAVEAKGRDDVIWIPQVARAAEALLGTEAATATAGVIPFAIKIIGPSLIHTIEFVPAPAGASILETASEAVLRLTPEVPGIE